MSTVDRPATVLAGFLAIVLGVGRRVDVRLVLDVGGLASLVVAAFVWSAGFAVLGIALLVLASRGERP